MWFKVMWQPTGKPVMQIVYVHAENIHQALHKVIGESDMDSQGTASAMSVLSAWELKALEQGWAIEAEVRR